MGHVYVLLPRNPFVPLRWVIFDAVGTLIEPQPGVIEVYHAAGRQHGSRLTVDEVRQNFRAAWSLAEQEAAVDGHRTSERVEQEFWRGIVERTLPDVTDHAAAFHDLFDWFAEPRHWRVFADVEPALETLAAAGLGLGIASNFDERLLRLCRELPALRRIERCWISTQLGFKKPSPQFFHTLLAELKLPPHEVQYVGDEPLHDVAPALATGLHSCHLARTGTPTLPRLARTPQGVESSQDLSQSRPAVATLDALVRQILPNAGS